MNERRNLAGMNRRMPLWAVALWLAYIALMFGIGYQIGGTL